MKSVRHVSNREANSRTLKVCYKYRSRECDIIRVPVIRLEGKWLDALGFSEGKKVQIDIAAGKLTIHLLPEEITLPEQAIK